MKHSSNKPWQNIALLFNQKKGILLHAVSHDYIYEIRRRMSQDKQYMAWLRKDDNKRYQEELARVEFDDLMNNHGYDELCHDSDYSECYSVLCSINLLSKQNAIKAKESVYTTYKSDKETLKSICRCGDWYFIFSEYRLEKEEKEINLDKTEKRGGKREGSGRKGSASRLAYGATTTVRVPVEFKKTVKDLIEFFINKEEEGVSLLSALSRARFALEQEADKWRKYVEEETPDSEYHEKHIQWAKEAEDNARLLEELHKIIPVVSIKKIDNTDI